MTNTVVIAFGCPRAGTTFLQKAVEGLSGAFAFKMAEWTPLHPCKSDRGLLDISRLFSTRELILVRIYRDPLEIAESFLAARTKKAGDKFLGIARHTDREVSKYICDESENVFRQKALLRERKNTRLIEVRYESLATSEGRKKFTAALAPFSRGEGFRKTLDTFGKRPVRAGRMTLGLGRVSTKNERLYFESRLKEVRKREGYV